MKRKYDFSEEEFREITKNSRSMTEASQKLNLPFSTFTRHAKKMGVYKPNQGGKGYKISNKKITREQLIDEFLVLNGVKKMCNTKLKGKIFEYNLKEKKCEECGQKDVWREKYLPLEMYHKDGNKLNNTLDNLEILCPQCHATYNNQD